LLFVQGGPKEAPYFIFDPIFSSNEILGKFFQQRAELWEIMSSNCVDTETVLVSYLW